MRVRKFKLALSLILGVILVLALSVSASAETVASGECGEGVVWTLDDTGLLHISGTGAIPDYGTISVPIDPEDPYIVHSTSYGDPPWLDYRDQVTAVEIAPGITGIGQIAFQTMEKIESVSFPEELQSVGFRAFFGCMGLRTVTLPAGMKSLGEESFSGCHTLTEVFMPDGLTEIGQGAFAYCSALEKVRLPSGITQIPPRMFESNTALKEIDIPAGVTIVGNKAFYGSGLEKIKLPEGLEILDAEVFYMTHLSSIDLPDSLYSIGDSCFFGCWDLTSISIPDRVSHLIWAFSGCIELKEVKLPAKLQSMYGAFNGCIALESIELPEGLNSIQNECFENTGLKEITLPSTLQEITGSSFNECTHLQSITFLGNAPTTIVENAFEKVTATVYYPDKNSTWTKAVRQNYGGSLTWVAFDGGVQQEGYRVFSALDKNYLVDVEGTMYWPDRNGDVFIPTKDAKVAAIYEYNRLDGDIHEQYPTQMWTVLLSYTDDSYQAEIPESLLNVLFYQGSSIRISGNKGIRMITGVPGETRDDLTSGAYGYTLLEYGTLVAWDSELKDGALTLDNPVSKSAFAYKKDVADPIYDNAGGHYCYTNVLVGFSNDQCIPDLSMRPYMKVQDEDGNVLTIYGGTVHRSIGYIAWQNRNAFQPGSASYKYIWEIIHHVYGTKYDADYKK